MCDDLRKWISTKFRKKVAGRRWAYIWRYGSGRGRYRACAEPVWDLSKACRPGNNKGNSLPFPFRAYNSKQSNCGQRVREVSRWEQCSGTSHKFCMLLDTSWLALKGNFAPRNAWGELNACQRIIKNRSNCWKVSPGPSVLISLISSDLGAACLLACLLHAHQLKVYPSAHQSPPNWEASEAMYSTCQRGNDKFCKWLVK